MISITRGLDMYALPSAAVLRAYFTSLMFCVLVCAVAGLIYPEYSFVESSVVDRGPVTSDVSPGSIVCEDGRVFITSQRITGGEERGTGVRYSVE